MDSIRIQIYAFVSTTYGMDVKTLDVRILDVMYAIGSFLIFLSLLIVLPNIMSPGLAYLLSIIVFIIIMTGVGYLVNAKIN